MDYRFVTHREVPDLPAQLARLSNVAFAEYEGAPEVDAAFIEWYLKRPGCTPDLCLAALHGEELAANVLVALQPLNLGGETITCGIVDTVATAPEHRRQGLARRLMDMAHDAMRQRGTQAAVLYTNPENHPYRFYGRLGYVTRAQCGLLTGRRPSAGGRYQVRPMESNERATVMDMVNGHFANREGFTRLDDAMWRWHREQRPPNMPSEVLVAEGEIGLAGTLTYARAGVLLDGKHQEIAVVSDVVHAEADCLQDLLAATSGETLAALFCLDCPEVPGFERLGFQTRVGEVSMVLPFTEKAGSLLRADPGPWYVMVESVVGV